MTDRPTTEEHAAPTTGPLRDRRSVLRTAGFVALAGGGAAALAACSSAGTTSPSTGAAPSSSAPEASPSSSAPSASAEPSESETEDAPSSAAPSGPNAATKDVPVGSGVILENDDYVITQPTAGSYKAFTAICTHQKCKVSEMREDVIHCGCHQSDFSIKDGSVVNPPAQQPLKEFKTTVSGGKVYVSV